jgi:hypothetical protein
MKHTVVLSLICFLVSGDRFKICDRANAYAHAKAVLSPVRFSELIPVDDAHQNPTISHADLGEGHIGFHRNRMPMCDSGTQYESAFPISVRSGIHLAFCCRPTRFDAFLDGTRGNQEWQHQSIHRYRPSGISQRYAGVNYHPVWPRWLHRSAHKLPRPDPGPLRGHEMLVGLDTCILHFIELSSHQNRLPLHQFRLAFDGSKSPNGGNRAPDADEHQNDGSASGDPCPAERPSVNAVFVFFFSGLCFGFGGAILVPFCIDDKRRILRTSLICSGFVWAVGGYVFPFVTGFFPRTWRLPPQWLPAQWRICTQNQNQRDFPHGETVTRKVFYFGC